MITAIIIAKDEQEYISGAISSLKGLCKKIIIVDDYSVDSTAEIAKELGAKVINPPKNSNFSEKRNCVLPIISDPWLFYLDADERLTKELVREIKDTVSLESSASAYWINRKNIILGKELRSKTWFPDSQPRLFKKDDFIGWSGHIHESANFKGLKANLKYSILHLTHRNIRAMVQKANDWSDIESKNLLAISHPRITSPRLFKLFATQFFSKYILDQNYKNGIRGVIESFLQTNSTMITYFKLWELQQKPTIAQNYEKIEKDNANL